MADWNQPTTESDFTDVISILKKRDENTARWFDNTNHANIVSGTKRWNDTQNRFEKWLGAQWIPLSDVFNINVTGLDGENLEDLASAVGAPSNRDAKNSILFDGLTSDDYLKVNEKAADSDLLDGLDSEQFLRSDTNDTMNGNLTMNGNINLQQNHLQIEDDVNNLHILRPDTEGVGIGLRASSNPNAGELIFAVRSAGGSLRLGIEHSGRLTTSNDFACNGQLLRLPRVTSDPSNAQVGDIWYRSDLD